MQVKRLSLMVLTFAFFSLISGAFAQSGGAAWVRIAHLVKDAPAVDVFVNGDAVLTDAAPESVGDYLALDAGTVSLAAAPTGSGMDMLVVSPTDVTLQADHRYTVAIIGQSTDSALTPLVIDETEAFASLDVDHASPAIFVNNLKGADGIDVSLDGETMLGNLAYGSFSVVPFAAKNTDSLAVSVSSDSSTVLFETPIFFEPSVVYVIGFAGTLPGDMGTAYDVVFPEGVTSRDTIDFLKGFSGLDIGFANFPAEVELPFDRQHFNFDTLLHALDAAGLTDELQNGGPYTLFAPTDDAFAALPAGELDAWMNDPEALRSLLSYHLVDGAMSMDQLLGAGMVTSVEGGLLDFTPLADEAFAINQDQAGCGCNYHTSNGYVYVLDRVLMPAND